PAGRDDAEARRISVNDAYREYSVHCVNYGEVKMSVRKFQTRMSELGFKSHPKKMPNGNVVRVYHYKDVPDEQL
ncbi:MAG: hypothetical protein NZ534_12725, partial [Bacteroidia bacterium]|nr:hypothetical protein [Bacteroidia bacterium]